MFIFKKGITHNKSSGDYHDGDVMMTDEENDDKSVTKNNWTSYYSDRYSNSTKCYESHELCDM